jgi:hypothetical protein
MTEERWGSLALTVVSKVCALVEAPTAIAAGAWAAGISHAATVSSGPVRGSAQREVYDVHPVVECVFQRGHNRRIAGMIVHSLRSENFI